MKGQESLWVSKHSAALKPYAGKWIAVFDDQVIASGDSVSEVMEEATSKIDGLPLVIRIPREEEDLHIL